MHISVIDTLQQLTTALKRAQEVEMFENASSGNVGIAGALQLYSTHSKIQNFLNLLKMSKLH